MEAYGTQELSMRVLAAFAHPDDETILIGGTLAMLAEHGAEVVILSATRGEGGEVGEPPVTTPELLGETREHELHCAAQALGAGEVRFLDYPDPPVGEDGEGLDFTTDRERLVGKVVAEIRHAEASVVITHGVNGEYGHPAHISMYAAVESALDRVENGSLEVYSVSAMHDDHPRPRLANEDHRADFVIDIRPWFPAKLAAAKCHRTQNALFVRRSSQRAGRQLGLAEVLMQTESLHRVRAFGQQSERDALERFLLERCRAALVFRREADNG
jgi:LmbE family N-acetylglucosaminyl deacetylase